VIASVSYWPWLVLAVLMFWSVGAYNRLVRLRNAILQCFAPVAQHLESRSTLLQAQIDLWAQRADAPSRGIEALRAAREQVDSARLAAHRQPGSADAIHSLRLALRILAETRQRAADAALPDSSGAKALREQLNACDHALQYAQGQFNDAVRAYNTALARFPVTWLGAVFGFRGAGLF
jgi:LemA protein